MGIHRSLMYFHTALLTKKTPKITLLVKFSLSLCLVKIKILVFPNVLIKLNKTKKIQLEVCYSITLVFLFHILSKVVLG